MRSTSDPFVCFYRSHVRLVFATALSQGLDSQLAEDAVQETFLRAWRHFERLHRIPAVEQRAWLLVAARNVARTLRKRSGLTGGHSEVEEVEEGGADGPEGRTALRIDVAKAMESLSETDQAIVLLRYFSECSSGEIGEMLGMPEGTVRRRLSESRQRLAARLASWSSDESGKEAQP
ncbi:MAG: sigma-70 family RNA polymerase sigma factor [Capsulimonadales bacterium]|nr:sigma-70 family RNA polymerase sigma factor [Capsulimonadales bacterium]